MSTHFLFIFYLIGVILVKCDDQKHKVEPCFSDRAVVEELQDVSVTCIQTEGYILMKVDDENQRFSICNPDAFQIEKDVRYTLEGKVYEIRSNERWPGTPFEILSLKKRE